MNKNSSLYTSFNVSSILSPGRSHQWLPSQTASQCISTSPCRCSGKSNRNSDSLNRNCLAGIGIYSHNSINSVNFHIIWSFVNRRYIITTISVLIKVVKFSIDPTTCICQIFISGTRINIFYFIVIITDNYPACGETALAVKTAIDLTTLN